MTKARSLRAFFKKFFNLDSTGMSVSAVLDEITQNNETFPGGGGGGGGGLFIATYTYNDDVWECDKTVAEIVGAIKRGAQVWAQNTDTGSMYFVSAWWENDENDLGVKFVYIDVASTEDGFSMGFDSFSHSYDSGREQISADSGWGEVHQ